MRTAARQALLLERLQTILTACEVAPDGDLDQVRAQISELLGTADPARLWLARSVLGGDLPDHREMLTLLRECRLFGPWAALEDVTATVGDRDGGARIRVVNGATTCDVEQAAQSDFTSGIQRVVRAVSASWAARHDVEFVVWKEGHRILQTLDAAMQERLLGSSTSGAAPELVVPWQGTHLLPELFADPKHSDSILALAKFSGCRVGVIGYDCVPMTTASSVAPGMSAKFGSYLAACRYVDRVATISAAAADEFLGWRQMLAGVRERGPEIAAIGLPVVAQPTSEEAMARAHARLGITHAPMVLVVGSHEPRKNHLAVLHAAETLWREGLLFTLVIAGAGSWRANRYYATVEELLAAGRPVLSVAGLPDEILWAAYRRAHCTLFPSFNEGFGLPVAESLAAGTPVITSDFGSTRDIVAPEGEPWGGLLVDPHDDDAIIDALRRMLTERGLRDRLAAETARHETGTWEDYAERVWDFLVEGNPPREELTS